MSRFAPALALLGAACTPQSAELSHAELYGFVSDTTSFTLIKGSFDPADVDGDVNGENWNVDCRVFENEEDEVRRLENPLDICDRNAWPPANEIWLDQGPYRAFRMPLGLDDNGESVDGQTEAWRGEAVVNNEGDLQVGFHVRMPGGGDFRFMFAIDPDFQPTECVVQDDGSTTRAPVDGDWIGGWSNEMTYLAEQDDLPPFLAHAVERNAGGRLFFLNARSYQFDPTGGDESSPDQTNWSLPEEWRAGFALGTFIDEDTRARYNRYGAPEAYIGLDDPAQGDEIPRDLIYYSGCEGESFEDCVCAGDPECVPPRQLRTEVRDVSRAVGRQLALVTPTETEFYRPIPHANEWRPIDSSAAGIDGWAEIAYSWVMLTPDSDPTKGGSVSGSFSILLDANDSISRFIVQGDFEIPSVKRDRWGPPDLRVEKAELAGDQPCAAE